MSFSVYISASNLLLSIKGHSLAIYKASPEAANADPKELFPQRISYISPAEGLLHTADLLFAPSIVAPDLSPNPEFVVLAAAPQRVAVVALADPTKPLAYFSATVAPLTHVTVLSPARQMAEWGCSVGPAVFLCDDDGYFELRSPTGQMIASGNGKPLKEGLSGAVLASAASRAVISVPSTALAVAAAAGATYATHKGAKVPYVVIKPGVGNISTILSADLPPVGEAAPARPRPLLPPLTPRPPLAPALCAATPDATVTAAGDTVVFELFGRAMVERPRPKDTIRGLVVVTLPPWAISLLGGGSVAGEGTGVWGWVLGHASGALTLCAAMNRLLGVKIIHTTLAPPLPAPPVVSVVVPLVSRLGAAGIVHLAHDGTSLHVTVNRVTSTDCPPPDPSYALGAGRGVRLRIAAPAPAAAAAVDCEAAVEVVFTTNTGDAHRLIIPDDVFGAGAGRKPTTTTPPTLTHITDADIAPETAADAAARSVATSLRCRSLLPVPLGDLSPGLAVVVADSHAGQLLIPLGNTPPNTKPSVLMPPHSWSRPAASLAAGTTLTVAEADTTAGAAAGALVRTSLAPSLIYLFREHAVLRSRFASLPGASSAVASCLATLLSLAAPAPGSASTVLFASQLSDKPLQLAARLSRALDAPLLPSLWSLLRAESAVGAVEMALACGDVNSAAELIPAAAADEETSQDDMKRILNEIMVAAEQVGATEPMQAVQRFAGGAGIVIGSPQEMVQLPSETASQPELQPERVATPPVEVSMDSTSIDLDDLDLSD